MTITWLCLFWLFFFYSFIGWCIEVCAAAVQHRKFVNRGFVAGPLCPIYGFGAILFEIFLPELTEDPFFLFLGGFVLASLLEYSTGIFFEKVYKKKLWDYSRFRYNVGGYICLPFSLLWGALSVVTVMFADPLLCGLFDRIPHLLSVVLLLVLGGLLLLDTVGSALSTLSLQVQAKHRVEASLEKQTARLDQITEGLGQTSRFLENALTRHIQKRLQKSYPSISPDADYVYICENNTIYGTKFKELPNTKGKTLVADVSSCFLSEPVDVSKYGIIYGGVQKNIGPAGMVIAIIREDLITEDVLPGTPTMLTYKTHADAGSLYNTPNAYCIYVCGKVFKWLKKMGGLEEMKKRNEEKAKILYDFLDSSKLFHGTVVPKDRSLMNVPFVTGDKEMDAKFVAEAAKAGLVNLKGHRTVGGMRASIYNAMPKAGVEALVAFMKKFEEENA